LGETLPGVYADDAFAQAVCAALDRVLAPVVTTLDSLPAYLDPRTAPQDVVDWLGSWVGLSLDGSWPPDRRRALVEGAGELHGRRGTPAGVVEGVRRALGVPPQLRESGAVATSPDPGAPVPGTGRPFLVVRLPRAAVPQELEEPLRGLVGLLVPAHVPWTLDLA
jgi:phage tail-like protein